MTQLVPGMIAILAALVYGWAAIWLAPYPTPWSAPWHVGALSRWAAAGNAAIRVIVPSVLVVASLLPYAPGSPAPRIEATPSRPIEAPFHAGSLDPTWMLPLLGVAALAGLVYLVIRFGPGRLSRGRKSDTVPTSADPALLRDLADQALLELLGEKDPRRAILACYALMERGLATRGLPRRPEETALEYAHRLLAGAGAPPAPLRSLTGLFQLAGFSTHAMNETMRQTAISSLRAFGEAAQ
jgi:uncharacterized protein DUF4129